MQISIKSNHYINESMQLKRAYIFIIFLLVLLLQAEAKGSMKIIDYKPSEYTEQVKKAFYYSIGKKLYYGKSISKDSPIIFKGSFFGGDLKYIHPSPDGKNTLVKNNGKLYLIKSQKEVILITEEFNHDTKVGKIFYTGSGQWSEDSKSFYITEQVKKEKVWEQSQSKDISLIRIDIDKPREMIRLISNFTWFEYYQVGKETICFNHAPGNGDLVWKCMYENKRVNVKSQTINKVILSNGVTLKEKPFFSDRHGGGGKLWLTSSGFYLMYIDIEKGIKGFYSRAYGNKPIFTIKTGRNFKGMTVDGIGESRSKVLPGERYAIVKVYYSNFSGKLLVDGLTGKYRELPSNTHVYRNLNSFNSTAFDFSTDGISRPEFKSNTKLRQKKKIKRWDGYLNK